MIEARSNLKDDARCALAIVFLYPASVAWSDELCVGRDIVDRRSGHDLVGRFGRTSVIET